MLAEPFRVLLQVDRILRDLAIPYALGGSVASGVHGESRATNDVDVLVDLGAALADRLVAALRPEFYVDGGAVADAIERRSSFNAIQFALAMKVDFFVSNGTGLDRLQLERRRPMALAGADGREVFVASPEDVVLRKLLWFRASGGALERQVRDVAGVLKIQGPRLDLAYLRGTAQALGIADLLEESLRKAGLAD